MTNKEKALKLINEYLAKQEPQKVELALVDDIEQAYKEMKSLSNQLDKDRNNSIDAVREYKLKAVRVKSYANDVVNRISKLEQSAKELGIDVPSNIQKQNNEAEELSKKATKLQGIIAKALNSL
jgi:hypothetical protein